MDKIIYYLNGFGKEVIAKYTIENVLVFISVCTFIGLLALFALAGFWGIFSKAGEKGWKVLIPFYNLYMTVKVSEQNGWLFLLFFVPVANLVFWFLTLYKICKRFEKSTLFAIGLFCIPGVFALILGFGKAQCLNPKEAEEEAYYYYYKPKF